MAATRGSTTTSEKTVQKRTGLSEGLNKGHITTRRTLKPKPSNRKGKLGKRVQFIRSLIREVCGFAPYEKRIMEYLKNNKDKRARKFAKKRLGSFTRAKKKVEEMNNVLVESRRVATATHH